MEGLALAEEIGDQNAIGRLCIARGHLWSRQHDYAKAEVFYFEGLERFSELKSRHGRAECVAGLAEIAYRKGRLRESAILFGWVYSVFYSMGLRWDLTFHNECERIVVDLQAHLGDEYKPLESQGAALPDDRIASIYSASLQGDGLEEDEVGLTYLPTTGSARRPIPITSAHQAHQRSNPANLTGRELEVLRLIASGLTNAEAAERLIVSPYTVNMHLRSIYHKLGVSNRSAATKFAVERHIV
jgi:DNA-binding CsgD family transcriptional regulator